MKIDTKYYENKFDELKLYHPYLIDHISNVRPRGDKGIRVTLDDGTQYDFGSMGSGIRRVISHEIDKVEDISEERFREVFVYNLTELMEARGFNQQTLAEYSGLSKGAINNYLNKKATPSFTAVQRIARALNCSINELAE